MISICECRIVWINGPFPGSNNDLTIYRTDLKNVLLSGEKILADGGYPDQSDPHLLIPYKKRPGQGLTTDEAKVNQMISSKRVRIEQVNRYFKNFGVMSGTWRGTEEQNGDIFKVLAKITNIYLQESPMYPE